MDGVHSKGSEIGGGIGDIRRSLAGLTVKVDALSMGAYIGSSLRERLDLPQERMCRARKILWSGITLEYVLPQALASLEEAVKHHADVTILIADPTSTALMGELQRSTMKTADRLDGYLKSALLNLQLLAERLPSHKSFILGFHQIVPTYGLLLVDPDDIDGLCYVSLHHPDEQIGCFFVLHAQQDRHWFKIFSNQFELSRRRSRLVDISAPEDVETSIDGMTTTIASTILLCSVLLRAAGQDGV